MSEIRALNILLVDDDELDVATVRRAFARAHLTNPLSVAGNGLEALALLRSGALPHRRTLVLLDLNMPRMNGMEFLRELRVDPQLRGTPVVVLTTSNEDRDKVAAWDMNVAGYLLKPVTFGTFVDVMSALHTYWTLVEMPSELAPPSQA